MRNLRLIPVLLLIATAGCYGQTAPPLAKPDVPKVVTAPKPAPAPVITADVEIAFFQSDRDVAQAKTALAEAEKRRDAAAQAVMAACKGPDWGVGLDQPSGRFKCVAQEKPKEAVAKK